MKPKKKIPAGKKGKGIRKLKKVAPQVAIRMGYKKGMKVRYWPVKVYTLTFTLNVNVAVK